MTREQLLLKLEESHLTMQTIGKMQNARASICRQYIKFTPAKRMWDERLGLGKWRIIIMLVTLYITVSTPVLYYPVRILTFYLPVSISDILTYVAAVILSILMPKLAAKIHNLWARKMNAHIEGQNQRISLKNQPLVEEERKAIVAIKEISGKLQQIMEGWFPPDYATMHHVEAFMYYIRNHEADNVKEAIACYKADAHRVQMEQSQRELQDSQAEMIRQQKFGNMLAVGNLIMQAGTQNAINQNTQAVNDAASRTQSAIGRNTQAINETTNAIYYRKK